MIRVFFSFLFLSIGLFSSEASNNAQITSPNGGAEVMECFSADDVSSGSNNGQVTPNGHTKDDGEHLLSSEGPNKGEITPPNSRTHEECFSDDGEHLPEPANTPSVIAQPSQSETIVPPLFLGQIQDNNPHHNGPYYEYFSLGLKEFLYAYHNEWAVRAILLVSIAYACKIIFPYISEN